MQLQPRDIKRFKKLYKSAFNDNLSSKQAKKRLSALLGQMQAVYRPTSKAQLNDYEKYYEDVSCEQSRPASTE